MTQVLVLNADGSPHATMSDKRAINLILNERANFVEGTGKHVRSQSIVFEIPSVIVLKRYINVPRRGAVWSGQGVFKRDNHICQYCGITTDKSNKWKAPTVDHIIPKSKGGLNTWGNTVCSCKKCNTKKGSRTPNEAGMKLLSEPKTPRGNTFVISRFGGEIKEEWRKYIEL